MKKLTLMLVPFLFVGCASFKQWIGDNISEDVPFIQPEPGLKYSETPQAGAPQDRQYKRMTKARMEEESDLSANAGSLWQMEGQTSYMFAQNKSRREGDSIPVKMEGSGMKQVETKANNIRTLLKEIEEEENRRKAQSMNNNPLAQNTPAPATDAKAGTPGAAAATPARAPAAAAADKQKEDKIDLSDVQNIQSKIIEKLADGNYRIKGSQPFMIDKKEYKAIISGVVKAEDFNDAGISSNKLIDPQFDVVSIRRAMKDEATN
jgi:flagellar L-ring protein precursor FlgH